MRGFGLKRVGVIVLSLAAVVSPGTAAAQGCLSQRGAEGFGPYNQGINDVAVRDQYVVAADRYGVTIYDISNPVDPVRIAEVQLPAPAISVTVEGTVAWVADGDAGLMRIDISDPTNPHITNTVWSSSTLGTAMDVAVSGDWAFVADGGNGLAVVDVSAQNFWVRALEYTCGTALDVALAGNGIAVIANGGDGLAVYDVSDPTTPSWLASVPLAGTAVDVAVSGDFVWVALTTGGVQVVDLSDPASPVLRGAVGTGGPASRVILPGGAFGYVADGDGGLAILAVGDPDAPTVMGSVATPGGAWGVAVSGGLGFVAGAEQGLRVVDVNDPRAPQEIGAYDMVAGQAFSVAVEPGDFACVADGTLGFLTVDISDPANPSWVGYHDVPGVALDVALHGTTALVAAAEEGLQLLSVADPTNIGFFSEFTTEGPAYAVALVGDLAVVAEGSSGIELVDVSDPAHPVRTGLLDTTGFALDIATLGGTLVAVADWNEGVQVVETSGTGAPYVVGHSATANPALGLAASPGRTLWVRESGEVSEILDLDDPAHPAFEATVPGEATSVTFLDDLAVVGMASGRYATFPSLEVWDLSTPGEPVFRLGTSIYGIAYGVAADPVTGAIVVAEDSTLDLLATACPTCDRVTVSVPASPMLTGGQTGTVTVRVEDLVFRAMPGLAVSGTTTLGSLSGFSDLGDGRYTATLTTGSGAGTAELSIRVDSPDGSAQCNGAAEVEIACAAGGVDAPSGLHAAVLGDDAIRITWTPPPGSHGAAVHRGSARIADVPDGVSSFTDAGLSPDTEYCYRVAALGSCGGEGPLGGPVCGRTTGVARRCPAPADTCFLDGNMVYPYTVSLWRGIVCAARIGGIGTWDATDPFHPVPIGLWESDEGVVEFASDGGGLLFVADGFNGLAVVDVSAPAAPRTVGRLHGLGWAYRAGLSGTTAYLVTMHLDDSESVLLAIDVSDPADPRLLGSVPVESSVDSTIAASGGLVALATWHDQLEIFDVSDPANIAHAASFPLWGEAWAVAISGDTVFVGQDNDWLRVLDVSDPTRPRSLARIPAHHSFRLAVVGGLLYSAAGSHGVEIFDVSDRRNPVLRGTIPANGGRAGGVAVEGRVAVVTHPEVGLQMADVSDPSAPWVTGTWDARGRAAGVAVTGTLACVADRTSLKTVDAADPFDLRFLGSVDLPAMGTAIDASGDYASVAVSEQGLQIVNLLDPANPFLAGRFQTASPAVDVAVSGDLAFVAVEGGGIEIVDIEDEFDPSLVSSTSSPSAPSAVAVAGDLVFVGGNGGIEIIDVQDPSNPYTAGSIDIGRPADLAVAGDLLLTVQAGTEGLSIIDVSDPANPRLLGGTLPFDLDLRSILGIDGTNLYAAGSMGFFRIDVADPADPRVVWQEYYDWFAHGALLGSALLVQDEGPLKAYTLTCRAPEPGFVWSSCGLEVAFNDRTRYGPDGWSWSFGDGGTSTESDPVHRFPGYGTWTVTLTVSGASGSATTSRLVRVGPDVNHDGAVDGLDVADLLAEIYDTDGVLPRDAVGGAHLGDPCYDLTVDGRIGAGDVSVVIGSRDP